MHITIPPAKHARKYLKETTVCNVTYRQDQTGFITPARVTSETIFTRPRVFRPCRSLYSPPEENGATTRSPILSLLLIIHIKKGLDQISS